MCCFSIYGQQNGKVYIDSLKGKSYEYFLEKLQVDELDENSIVLSNAYLQKAKSEKNWKQMMNAYKIILHQVPKRQRIFYANSMIVAARRTKENDLIGSAYLTKGIVYYDLQDFNNALDNYLIADEFIATTTDEYLKYKAKYNIAQIKYYLGFYDEAALLFQESIRYFKSEDHIPYLTSLHAFALCYNRLLGVSNFC